MADEADSSQASFGGAPKLDNLSDKQKKEVESQSRPNAALIHETIRAEGLSELERAPSALALSGLAAGLSIGFSFITEALLSAALPSGPAHQLVPPLGYTVGFLIVVLGRQQLFTENTLTPVLPLLHNRQPATLNKLLRLWAIVLVANIAGSVLLAAALANSSIFEPQVTAAFISLGQDTLRSGFGITLLRAVFAGWLIATMVWLLPSAESAKPAVIVIITYVVALGGFSHIIAGSVDCAFLVLSGGANWGDYALRFFAPTLLGNLIGGVTLVAVLNYGQSAPEIKDAQ